MYLVLESTGGLLGSGSGKCSQELALLKGLQFNFTSSCGAFKLGVAIPIKCYFSKMLCVTTSPSHPRYITKHGSKELGAYIKLYKYSLNPTHPKDGHALLTLPSLCKAVKMGGLPGTWLDRGDRHFIYLFGLFRQLRIYIYCIPSSCLDNI